MTDASKATNTTKPTPAAIAELEPAAVWRFFAGLAATPRPSKKEKKIRAHLMKLAADLKLAAREDAIGNIVIDVPASPGCEKADLTVLQGHVDMVCEKNAGTSIDFENDSIPLVRDKDANGVPILRAEGTTLGADNGIGVALALAAATEPDVVHGPLELLFTVDEEMGMTGAGALTPDSFKGRRLINLDSEEDDVVYMGCAGGADVNLAWELPRRPLAPQAQRFRVTVAGLRGGHSGGDIHEGRANANKLLVRTLLRANRDDLRLIEVSGGSKRNAIPREAHAVVGGTEGLANALQQAAQQAQLEAREESHEEGVSICVEPVEAQGAKDNAHAIAERDTQRLLCALAAIPSGVLGMHPKVPTLVETSNNLSTLDSEVADEGETLRVVAGALVRSSSESRLDEALDLVSSVGFLSNADVRSGNRYPGWSPNVDSPLLATTREIYTREFGEAPKVAAIHAGLECGIIGQRVGHIDMVSFGPRIEGAHSPDERVWIESVQKTWRLLKAVLKNLTR